LFYRLLSKGECITTRDLLSAHYKVLLQWSTKTGIKRRYVERIPVACVFSRKVKGARHRPTLKDADEEDDANSSAKTFRRPSAAESSHCQFSKHVAFRDAQVHWVNLVKRKRSERERGSILTSHSFAFWPFPCAFQPSRFRWMTSKGTKCQEACDSSALVVKIKSQEIYGALCEILYFDLFHSPFAL
jgi:hypothetical protein